MEVAQVITIIRRMKLNGLKIISQEEIMPIEID